MFSVIDASNKTIRQICIFNAALSGSIESNKCVNLSDKYTGNVRVQQKSSKQKLNNYFNCIHIWTL